MSRCHIVWNRNPDVPRYLRGEAVEAYEERRNTGGRLRFFFYHLMFGVIIAISVLGPMFRPALLQGAAPEVIIGGYLAIGSPLALSAGPFRRFWLARLAAAHPVRIADDGLTFPTGLPRRGSERIIPWTEVKFVGTDFAPKSPYFKFRTTAIVWLALRDGRIFSRPYHLGEDASATLRATLSRIEERLQVLDVHSFRRAVGMRIPARYVVLAARAGSVLCIPLLVATSLGLYLLNLIQFWGSLLFGLLIEGVILGVIPLWAWATF